jgi:hypothetical protein
MIDLQVQTFLQSVVNSKVKLQFLLLFYENPRMQTTASALAQHCCVDIWSAEEALRELADSGILQIAHSVGGKPSYGYAPYPEFVAGIDGLVRSYDDPMRRDSVLDSIREIQQFHTFYHAPASPNTYAFVY